MKKRLFGIILTVISIIALLIPKSIAADSKNYTEDDLRAGTDGITCVDEGTPFKERSL